MEHKTWTTIDKASWGDGPWLAEPDKEQFADEATGLPCLIRRNPRHGSLCGYVGVSEGHPWAGTHFSDLDVVNVHDGLSYSGFCQEGPEAETICHVPAPAEPDRVWWLGFSCGGTWDVRPAADARDRERGQPLLHDPGDSYKDIAYVKAECARLAAQAAAAISVPV